MVQAMILGALGALVHGWALSEWFPDYMVGKHAFPIMLLTGFYGGSVTLCAVQPWL